MMDETQTKLPEDIEAEKAEENLRASVFEWVESAIFALVCVTLIFSFAFRIVGVSGSSMVDTLHDGDRLMMVNAFYKPDYGDIVIIRRDTEEPIVKRVIAMAGDTVEIDPETEAVYLNGQLLEEPYLACTTPALFDFTGPYTVPEGTVFVMGDNRHNSHDSRAKDIGAVPLSHIMGKAVFRIWPVNSIGKIAETEKA